MSTLEVTVDGLAPSSLTPTLIHTSTLHTQGYPLVVSTLEFAMTWCPVLEAQLASEARAAEDSRTSLQL